MKNQGLTVKDMVFFFYYVVLLLSSLTNKVEKVLLCILNKFLCDVCK